MLYRGHRHFKALRAMAVHPIAGSAAKAAGAAQAAADAIGHRALAKFELLSAPSRREPWFVFAASWKLRLLTASSSSGEVTAFSPGISLRIVRRRFLALTQTKYDQYETFRF